MSSAKETTTTPVDSNVNDEKDQKKDSSKKETTETTTTTAATASSNDHEELITEGSAQMLLRMTIDRKGKKQPVFYNPVQVQNRDLSILMILLHAQRTAAKLLQTTKKDKKKKNNNKNDNDNDKNDSTTTPPPAVPPPQHPYRILDALAASGLRSVRYHKEITTPPPLQKQIIINDMSEAAILQARDNLKLNNLTTDDDHTITIEHSDATHLLYTSRTPPHKRFAVIDLDPYGSAAPFLDGAVQAVESGGLLCVTCTDMAAMSGGHPETCYGRYGSFPMPKARYLHEGALRILLYAVHTTAMRYGRSIKPILSVGMDFYIRVFVEVYDSKSAVLDAGLKVGHVYQSTQCPSFYVQPICQKKGNVYQPTRGPPVPECESTGAPFKMGGPYWIDPIHDTSVVETAIRYLENDDNKATTDLLKTKKRIHGLLTVVKEELPDVPLYYTLPNLTQVLHCTAIKFVAFSNAIKNAGYRISSQHKNPQAIKTDAPPEVIWDIMRAHCEQHPVNDKWLTGKHEHSAAAKILNKKRTLEVDWKGDLKRYQVEAVRYPMNPTKNWGPKPRATGIVKGDDDKTPPKKTDDDDDGDDDDDDQAKNGNGAAEKNDTMDVDDTNKRKLEDTKQSNDDDNMETSSSPLKKKINTDDAPTLTNQQSEESTSNVKQ